jgi:multisubunit Na+/H+ antiporter MnhB subunit
LVKRFRLYVSEDKAATPAGCALALLTAVVTIAVCLAFGPAAVRWATPLVGWVGRRVAVAVVCGVLIAPGALFFLLGAAILKRFGFAAWEEVGGEERSG